MVMKGGKGGGAAIDGAHLHFSAFAGQWGGEQDVFFSMWWIHRNPPWAVFSTPLFAKPHAMLKTTANKTTTNFPALSSI